MGTDVNSSEVSDQDMLLMECGFSRSDRRLPPDSPVSFMRGLEEDVDSSEVSDSAFYGSPLLPVSESGGSLNAGGRVKFAGSGYRSTECRDVVIPQPQRVVYAARDRTRIFSDSDSELEIELPGVVHNLLSFCVFSLEEEHAQPLGFCST